MSTPTERPDAMALYARSLAAAHRDLANIYELIARHTEGGYPAGRIGKEDR